MVDFRFLNGYSSEKPLEVKPDERGIGYYKAQAAYYMSLAERLQRKVDAATFLRLIGQEIHNTNTQHNERR